MSSDQDIIVTRGLCKSYGSVAALSNLSMRLAPGRLVGFLGPNGAGKSTTIRILLGLLKPTSGEATVFGQSCWRSGPSIRRRVGYLPGDLHLYDQLTGRATLQFMANARRVDCEQEKTRLVRAFDLDLSKRVRQYSTGMRQKLGLIQALMHRPDLLVLDEPTSGLDPLVRQTLYDQLRAVAAEGRTVLFSSHTLSEVEQLCDEVIILRDGQLVEQQRVDELRQMAVRRVTLQLAHPPADGWPTPEGMQVIRCDGELVTAIWSGTTDHLVQWLQTQRLRDLSIAPPDLEALFLAYYSTEHASFAGDSNAPDNRPSA